MTDRTTNGHFVSLAQTAGWLAAVVSICALARDAAAQTQPTPPPIIVYVTPGGQIPYQHAQRDAVVSPQGAPQQASTQPAPQIAAELPAMSLPSPAVAEDTKTVAKMSYELPADARSEPEDFPLGGAPGGECGLDGCGPSCGPRLGLVGGMELTWIKPEIDDGTLRTNLTDSAGIGRSVTLDMTDFDAENVQVAPRFWLGLQGECWGVVARVWRLDSTESDHSIFIGGSDVGYDFASEIDMYTVDFEVTRNFYYGCDGTGLATFGVRHARADRNGSLDFIGETPDGVFASFARFGQSFEGTGLTGSLSTSKPIFCGSSIHWFGSLRGSILWGDSSIYSDTAALSDAAAGLFARNTAVAGREDELFIGEAQLGLQWQRYLQCAPASVFLRTAFEFQTWSAPSGSTEAESFAGFGTSLITTNAATDGIDLNLFGFGIATGFNW